ncbi:MAG TPA: HRDC domain-containing protein [Nitriliruptoraceae bacterium]|nr:HRDC domain-containing protein [Nitriliruptoraceae bacterium]
MHQVVDQPGQLTAALAAIDADVVGVDVERTAAPRYHKPAALIQVGTADRAVLVDSHLLGPTPELGEFLRARRVVAHAATNDIESLDSASVRLDELDDTSIAAALLGLPTGLDPLLQELLDIALSPDKDKYQRANWERRPLPDEMAAYAAGDVLHLPALMEELHAMLDDLDRVEWYDQERAHMLASTRAATRSWEDTKGSGRLDPSQRAVLRALWECREQIADRRDLAPNTVLREATLVDLATDPATTTRQLQRRNERRGKPDDDAAELLFDAMDRGLAADPEPRPRRSSSNAGTAVDRERHAAMRTARSEVAKELDVDAGVLCPGRVLWGPVHADVSSPDELVAALDLRPWQLELLRDPLWTAWESVDAPTD